MSDDGLLRYSRHLLLDDIGIDGQARLGASRALVVGAGGLGSPVALFLGSAGIGRLTIADGDRVSLTNLQRQIAHDTARLGEPKAASAALSVRRLNPEVDVVAVDMRLDGDALLRAVADADVVVDCSDNFETRHAVNAACVAKGRPLVSGAAIGFDAQVSVFDPRDAACPCYACVFPAAAGHEDAACATMGVFAPLVGIVGSVQAAEALKLAGRFGTPLAGRLLMLDARRMAWTELAVSRDPACAVCASRAAPGGSVTPT